MFLGVGEVGRKMEGISGGIKGEEPGEVGDVGRAGGWCCTPCTTGRGEYT